MAMWKRLIPFAHAKSIYEIDTEFYKKLGIKYVFCDLDNTLDSYKQAIPTEKAICLKNKLSDEGIELIITSNNTGKRVTLYSTEYGVRFLSAVGKPFSRKLKKKIKELGINKDEIIMIGDQVVTDIGCANGCGIKSVLTDKLVKEDQPTTRFNRLFDRPLRKKLSKKGLLKDWRTF